jgi:SAM-dependent methyltransferase
VSRRSSLTLDAAAVESARILSGAVASCAVSEGILAALEHPRTAEDLARRCAFHPSKIATVRSVLDILHGEGVVERHPDGEGSPRYRAVPADRVGLARRPARPHAVEAWLPPGHDERIWRSQRAFLGPDLDFLKRAGGHLTFDAATVPIWQVNLENPLYFGRLFAVRALAAPGRRYLDLASGLGLGARQLAQSSDWRCRITCVDKSADFIAVSRRLPLPETVRVDHVVWDLNAGLPPQPAGSVDGVLFVGAFHYIRDKRRLLSEIRRALRPGGRLAIGHCFVRSGRPDEAANDYMFSIAAEPSWIVTLMELRRALDETSFEVVEELHRGSQYSIVVERPAAEAAADGPP